MNLSGSLLDYPLVFLGGIFLSLTPCVYPLIPVTVAIVGAGSGGSRSKGFILSLAYVTGIAITYSLLGLFVSLTGRIFGYISAYPLTHLVVGILIIFLGIAMWGLFNFPAISFSKSTLVKRKGYFSIFLLGLGSGLVISPCTTPVLGAILLMLATKKDILYGTTLLFVFAYGMGLVLILAGTFSSFLASLPKSDKWMLYIKRIYALILVIMGGYFIFEALRRL